MTDSAANKEVIGVVGLGAMGAPMAEHLQRHHGNVVITARRPRPELIARGMTWADTPCQVASQVSSLLIMLPDLPQLEDVLQGPDGILAGLGARELLLLIGSTSSATGVRGLAARLAEETDGRIHVVDCPVSGGEDGAAASSLSIMVGGTDDDGQRALAVLAPCGNPVHLGPLGAGQVAKACNQMVVSATILALGEATVLADRSGLDLAKMWDLLAGGYAGSNLLASRRDKLVTGDDSPSGVARYMVKDLSFAAQIAEATHTHPILLPTLQQAFDEIVSSGLGDRDIAVTRRAIAER